MFIPLSIFRHLSNIFYEYFVLFIILIPLLDLFIKIIFILCTYIHTHAYINTHTHMHTYVQTTHTYMT